MFCFFSLSLNLSLETLSISSNRKKYTKKLLDFFNIQIIDNIKNGYAERTKMCLQRHTVVEINGVKQQCCQFSFFSPVVRLRPFSG